MSKTADVVRKDLREILAASGDNYVAAYEAIVAKVKSDSVERAPKSNIASRKAAWKLAVKTLDRSRLANINKTMQGYVRLVKANAEITNSDPHVLAVDEANSLMDEFLALKKVEEFIGSRREQIRHTVFGSLDESAAAAGEDHPENTNGKVEAPEHGKSFSREGTGRKDPKLDEDKLAELLGPELWAEATITEEIPAHTKTTLDHEALMGIARRNPEVLEMIRDALVPGDWKAPRMWVRDI